MTSLSYACYSITMLWSMAHGNLYRSPSLLGITEATEATNEHNIFAHLQSKIDPKCTKHACIASSLGCFWLSGSNPNTNSHTAPVVTLVESKAYQKAMDFFKSAEIRS